MLKLVKTIIFLSNAIIVLALISIHFVIKDRTYDSSILFYVFPLPIIILIILVCSIFLKKKHRTYNLILAGILLVVWFGRSFRISFNQNIEDTDLDIVFWNASRDNGFKEAFIEHETVPDILVLSESKGNNFKALQEEYPNYFFYKSNGELDIFSKTPLKIVNDKKSKYNSNVVHFKTTNLEFYAVDVAGSTDVPRSWELNFVNSIVSNSKKTIILGDFNVPYESLFLKKIKANYQHFFSKKGNGFRETWFWNLPILSLDHIWVSKDLNIINSKKIRTKNSDHVMIKTIVRK